MVQLMSSSKRVAAKLELEEALEDELSPLHTKRSKLDLSNFQEGNIENGKFPFQLEPSPLGLNLKKSPSFLDLIQMKLSEQNATNLSSLKKKDGKASTVPSIHDKLKASNFPASLLRIGSWEYKSRYEGDLVAKCYYAKHKLVWEVLDGGLKNKIEFQWSDIIAIKGNYPDDRPGTVELVLARQPLFFRETNPQPRKHTLWQATSDFTDGQASLHRQHFLQCPPGLLGKHFEKLIQCDPRLNCLSKQAEISLESPYFEPRISGFGDSNEADHGVELKSEERPSIFGLQDPLSPSAGQSSSCNNEKDSGCRAAENFCRRAPSPSSVVDTRGIDKIGSCMVKERKLLKQWDQIRVPGIHASMSMSDLVNHIGNCISEQMTYSSDDIPSRDILEEITQYLLNDSQHASAPDEQCLMSRVNSLCCLLQKDSGITSNFQTKEASDIDVHGRGKNVEGSSVSVSARDSKSSEGFPLLTVESDDVSESYRPWAMSRKDSVGDFLLNLPRIASLPKFLFNIMEDSGIEAIKTNGPKAFSATRTDK